jgi:opacity protein-like surface antigen
MEIKIEHLYFMKKTVSVIAIILGLASSAAMAQIEINGYYGYMPGSHTMYSYNGYRLKIDGGDNWGVGLGVATPIDILIEFSYMRFSSILSQDGGIEIIQPQPINVEYYQLGGYKPFIEGENFVPYGVFSLGASRFNPTEDPDDYWRFAIGLGVGMKYFFTDMVGIKLQARMLMPLYFGGVGFGCGIGTGGSGCGGGATFGTEILQGDFTGGVVLRIDR